jgi:hypothetical protein
MLCAASESTCWLQLFENDCGPGAVGWGASLLVFLGTAVHSKNWQRAVFSLVSTSRHVGPVAFTAKPTFASNVGHSLQPPDGAALTELFCFDTGHEFELLPQLASHSRRSCKQALHPANASYAAMQLRHPGV